jgi:hypothetical protein
MCRLYSSGRGGSFGDEVRCHFCSGCTCSYPHVVQQLYTMYIYPHPNMRRSITVTPISFVHCEGCESQRQCRRESCSGSEIDTGKPPISLHSETLTCQPIKLVCLFAIVAAKLQVQVTHCAGCYFHDLMKLPLSNPIQIPPHLLHVYPTKGVALLACAFGIEKYDQDHHVLNPCSSYPNQASSNHFYRAHVINVSPPESFTGESHLVSDAHKSETQYYPS